MGYANNLDWTRSTLGEQISSYRNTNRADLPVRRLRSGGYIRLVLPRRDGRWFWAVRRSTDLFSPLRPEEGGIEDTVEMAMHRAEGRGPLPSPTPIRPPSSPANAAAVRSDGGLA